MCTKRLTYLEYLYFILHTPMKISDFVYLKLDCKQVSICSAQVPGLATRCQHRSKQPSSSSWGLDNLHLSCWTIKFANIFYYNYISLLFSGILWFFCRWWYFIVLYVLLFWTFPLSPQGGAWCLMHLNMAVANDQWFEGRERNVVT